MNYHIDTGLIKEKFATPCDCPLCEIEKVAEKQFLHEFLNDAVMNDECRITVREKGFCKEHFSKLFNGQNKLSVALQIDTRIGELIKLFEPVCSSGKAKKRASEIKKAMSGCVICDLLNESMQKYYKTIAQLFAREKEFSSSFCSCNGFCIPHYSKLLQYSSCAGSMTKEYLSALSLVQKKSFDALTANLKTFCNKHDYRNANLPLGGAENALPTTYKKLYGDNDK